MDAEQPLVVETPVVRCDGGGGPLGHPAVYLNFGAKTQIVCPYCSRKFVRVAGTSAAGQH